MSIIKTLRWIDQTDLAYPVGMGQWLGTKAPARFTCLGALDLLKQPLLGLFSSVTCPGSLILQAHDLAKALQQAGILTISGFHSSVEKEMLTILLRGNQPIVMALARGLERMRIPDAYTKPLEQGRMLLISPFDAKQRRPTEKMTETRNLLVGALAERVLVIHAEPGGKLEQQCAEFLRWGKRVLTPDNFANQNLVGLGALPIKGMV